MKKSPLKTKALVIDEKKNKLLLAGIALLAGLTAALALSGSLHAKSFPKNGHFYPEEAMKKIH